MGKKFNLNLHLERLEKKIKKLKMSRRKEITKSRTYTNEIETEKENRKDE